MPTPEQHHESLIKGITQQFKRILDESPQAIYIYLDDNHKACNKKFADLLGYKSPREWAEIDAPLADVVEKDQQRVIDAYQNASGSMTASTIDVNFKNVVSGKIIKARMTTAPIGYEGHVLTAHFLSVI